MRKKVFLVAILLMSMIYGCEDESYEQFNQAAESENQKDWQQYIIDNYFEPMNQEQFKETKSYLLMNEFRVASSGNEAFLVDSLKLDAGIEIQIEDTLYYTIPYIHVSDEYYYNLYIEEYPDGSIFSARMRYHPSTDGSILVSGISLELNQNPISQLDRVVGSWNCRNVYLHSYDGCCHFVEVIEVCDWTGGAGGGGIPPPPPPYGGGGGSGGGSAPPPTTTPISPPSEDECETLAGDLNGDCMVDDYETCILTGDYEESICDCVGEGNSYDYCFEEEKRRKECDKIQDLLDEYSDSNEYMAFVRDFKNHHNEDFETFLALDKDGQAFGGTGNTGDSTYEIPLPENKYISFSHNHPLGIPSSSIFSSEDLKGLGRAEQLDLLKINEFIKFLASGKNTYYAITINNVNKFREFFYRREMITEFQDVQTQLGILSAEQNRETLFRKYFTNEDENGNYIEGSGLIDEFGDETKNDENLRYFLQFLVEADMGVSLFESDENFETFTPLSLDENGWNILRHEPCELN